MSKEVVPSLSTQQDAVRGANTGRSISERGKALEDKYFRDRDQELIRALRPQQAETPKTEAESPKVEPEAEPKAEPKTEVSRANPHSDRALEELYFEEENRRAVEAMKRGKK